MASEWRETTLGEFVRLQRGHDLTAEERKPGEYPVMGSAGQNGTHGQFIAHGPGVVIGRSGASMGRVHFTPHDYWPHNTCLYVTDFLGNDPRFAFYLLGSLDLASYNSGSAQPSLNRNYIYTKPIQVPLPQEQAEIAEFLGALDDRIDNLRQTNATLQAIAAALFKSRFVDFDGVPPEDMQESELGLIPKGWRVASLDDAFEVNPKRELKKGVVAPYLDMASLPTTGAVPGMPVMREFSSGTKFANGDTLLARITPCLENGKTAFVAFLEQGQVGWGSTEFIVLRPKPPLPSFFGYLLARRTDFRENAIRAMSGTSGRQRVEISQLHNFKIVIPDEAPANAFAEFIEPLQEALFANEAQAATLAALRDALLPRLISGRLRMGDAC